MTGTQEQQAANAAVEPPEDAALRRRIRQLLEEGLQTEVHPRADTPEMVQEVVHRLQEECGDDLQCKLVVAGFTLQPVEHGGMEQACETCMYYLIHRKWCELPELDVPVEPQWSCRLWRI